MFKFFVVVLIAYNVFSNECSAQIVQKPNILWLSCEDLSTYFSFYGDSTAKTPNLDRLAAESMIFTNAFAVVPVCAPSRSAVITGMYPASIGTHHQRTGSDIGEWGKRQYENTTSNQDIIGKDLPEYSAVTPAYVKCFTEYLRNAGYYCTNNSKTDYQFAAPQSAWDENNSSATWRNRSKNQPFFSVFNFDVTHESKIWANANLPQTVSPEDVPLPPYYPDNDVLRKDVARNYSNIELLDQQIGEKLAELKKDGLYDNTIIFFFSDHGGPLPRGKREVYDSGLKVPMLVRFPQGKNAGKIDELFSFVDFAPTLLSLAHIKPPTHFQGQAFFGPYKSNREYIFGSSDRFDNLTDRVRIVRDKQYLFVKNYFPNLPPYKNNPYRNQMAMMQELSILSKAGTLTAIENQWFKSSKEPEEFYDCSSDPHNINKLIGNPHYTKTIAGMRNRLLKHVVEINDKAIIPESEMIQKMWPGLKQPQTNKPKVKFTQNKIELSCKTKGSSITYILSQEKFLPDLNSKWQLYNWPIAPNNSTYIYIKANRIGFANSEVVVRTLNIIAENGIKDCN